MKLRVLTVIAAVLLMVAGCAGKTNLSTTRIDTVSHHVANGMLLIDDSKTEAAVREFKRALELNATYAPAYVGLGLAYGQKGELRTGLDFMRKAETYAHGDAQHKLVKDGYTRLRALAPRKEKK